MQIACTDQEREVRVRGLRASVSGLYCVHLRTQRLRTVPVCVCVASRLHTSASAIFARTNGYCSVGSLTEPTTAAAPAATILRLRYTATHTAPTASRPLSSRPPHSLPLPRPAPPLNQSSVSRVGRALTSETSDDGLGPMRATKSDEHFPTPAGCLCGPASPRGAVKRRPRPVTASSTALCTGQALCQLRQQHSRSPPRRGPVYSPGTHG